MPVRLVVVDDLVPNGELVEDFPCVGKLFGPLARQRELARPEEELPAPFHFARLPAFERLDHPPRIDLSFPVPRADLSRLTA